MDVTNDEVIGSVSGLVVCPNHYDMVRPKCAFRSWRLKPTRRPNEAAAQRKMRDPVEKIVALVLCSSSASNVHPGAGTIAEVARSVPNGGIARQRSSGWGHGD